MELEQNLVLAAVAALATLLAPLVAWILPNVGKSRRAQEAALLRSRAGLVRDLLEIHKTIPLDEPAIESLSRELSGILAELREPLPGPAESPEVGELPRFRRWLLLLPLASVGAKVYRAAFYVLAILALLAAVLSPGLSPELWFSVVVYLALALGFRAWAASKHDAAVRHTLRLRPCTTT